MQTHGTLTLQLRYVNLLTEKAKKDEINVNPFLVEPSQSPRGFLGFEWLVSRKRKCGLLGHPPPYEQASGPHRTFRLREQEIEKRKK